MSEMMLGIVFGSLIVGWFAVSLIRDYQREGSFFTLVLLVALVGSMMYLGPLVWEAAQTTEEITIVDLWGGE